MPVRYNPAMPRQKCRAEELDELLETAWKRQKWLREHPVPPMAGSAETTRYWRSMMANLRTWITPSRKLPPPTSERKRLVDVGVAMVLTIIPLAVGLAVRWRWFVWSCCLVFVVGVFLPDYFPILRTFPRKSKTLVLGVAVLAFAVVCYPIENAQWRIEQSEALEGDLLGSGTKPLPAGVGAPPFVQVGTSNSIMFMVTPSTPIFKPFPDAEFLVEPSAKGPLVSTTVRDSEAHVILTIKRNHWQVYPPYCQDKNYNQTSLEVIDSEGHVVFQLVILPHGGNGADNSPKGWWGVQIQAEWWDNEGHGLRVQAAPNGINGEVNYLGKTIRKDNELINPIFEYPSKSHWGQLVGQAP